MQGSLLLRTNTFDVPFWETKWRDANAKQIKRRLAGDAWVERDDDGDWQPRAGKPAAGCLTRDGAVLAATAVQVAYESEQAALAARSALGAMASATFADVAEAWLQRATRRGRKRSTVIDYRQTLDSYLTDSARGSSRIGIKPAPFALSPVGDMTGPEATAIMKTWFDSMPIGRTREKLLTIVRGILRFAVNEDYVPVNIALRVDRNGDSYDGSYDFYSVEEIRSLLDATIAPQDRLLWLTAARAGLRRGELIGLHWRDVDFDGCKLVVRGNVSHRELVRPKSGKLRIVPLVPDLANALREARPTNAKPTDLVFPGERGAFMDPSALRRRYVKAVQAAGLRHLPLHSLRHHFASQAIQVASVQQVRSWCGHSDLRTTGRYMHSRSSAGDAELLSGAFAA